MERKWVSHFAGIGFRYTDIIMNILILHTDRKAAMKMWDENISWWSDQQITLRFIEENEDYWFILYHRGNNFKSKDNIGFLRKNPLTANYSRFKNNYDQKTILRFALYKSAEKIIEKKNFLKRKSDDFGNKATFELEIFKKMKTIYDVKFLKLNELGEDSLERSLVSNIDFQNT
jgi:hypothetical protein